MKDISPARAFPFTIVGFDLDGTLLDTSEDLAAAANHALAVAGRAPLPVAEVIARVGGGTRNMLAQVLAATGESSDALVERLLPEQLAYYQAHMTVHTRPYPGVEAALAGLRDRGIRLGVVTNKLERFAVELLAHTGLVGYFGTVIGGDSVPTPKPDPAPIRLMIERLGGGAAAFVGDSRYDVMAAQAAGAPVVACRFGFASAEVDSLGAEAVIDGFDALIAALERL